MQIRKEQVLALLALALGGWIWSGMGGTEATRIPQPKLKEYEPAPVKAVALVGAAIGGLRRSDLFTQPSETQALPPRELGFPPRAPLSVAALPLDPGPDFRHALLLRDEGSVVEGVTLQVVPAAAPEAAEASAAEQGSAETREAKQARAAKTYDRVFQVGLASPFFGFVEVEGVDPYDAEKLTDFEGKIVKLRPYSIETGKIGATMTWGNDDRKVQRIQLADTLRNAVEREKRTFKRGPQNLDKHGELIQWLLGQAREASWIYDVALEEADLYVQVSGGDLEGLRWQQRVLRARGDLAAEFALLDGIQGPHRETAFRYEGLGVVKAALCLYLDAEQDLQKAVALAPNDARPHGALAEFLRQRGRTGEAAVLARRAEEKFGSLLDASDRGRVGRTIVACHLAIGAIPAARAALKLIPADQPQPYLEGCVAYAQSDLPAALGSFQKASTGDDRGAALLGQAACLLRSKQWQEAYDAFVAVADREPLLRHRANCGLALLHLRLGLFDGALGFCDRALEADPQDAYAHYLRGRTLRSQGQLGAAAESLAAALRLHDDFVHAIAEMAEVNAQKAAGARGEEAAQGALAAVRYGDRAVALAPLRTVELFEKQALHRFAAADPIRAKAALEAARDAAPVEADKLFAKGAIAVVDYSRGLVEDATAVLRRQIDDLAKDHPMRLWADSTLSAIDDHAQKEMLSDRFERSEPGSVWNSELGLLRPKIHDNRLVVDGKLDRAEVTAERVGAVKFGKNFLAVGVVLQQGSGQSRAEAFAGLRVQLQRGGGGTTDCQIDVGVREGKPALRITDDRKEPQWIEIKVDGFDPLARHELELRVMPRGEALSRAFALHVRWNGALVHQQDLKSLSGATATELKTILFASGRKGDAVDVAFDDYRLERRKETK